jgi:hypothetical protein
LETARWATTVEGISLDIVTIFERA